jgi:hypothetical protein
MFYAEHGYVIVTGNAHGADQAFALGANMIHPALVELCLPWRTYNDHAIIPSAPLSDPAGNPAGESLGNTIRMADQATDAQRELAQRAHNAWDHTSSATQRLFTRNAQICDGIEFLLAHPNLTKDGWGGTGHTMRVAAMLGIPVWMTNLWRWWDPIEGQQARTA